MSFKSITVRCANSTCGEIFPVQAERAGRNIYCVSCGSRLTARPVEIDAVLKARASSQPAAGVADTPRLPFRVVVDNVRSLWNVGAIFRTADACAVERLLLCGITGHPPRAEISKTALGAEQFVPWEYREDSTQVVDEAIAAGFEPVLLESGPGSTPIGAFEWPDKVLLVVGNEVAGVPATLLERFDKKVSIPMLGTKESLNVAVAFGIAAAYAAASLVRSKEANRTDRGRSTGSHSTGET